MPDDIRGFAFPLRFGPLGHLERADGAEKISGNLKNIALTRLEERETAPGFGTLGFSALMRNIDTTTYALLRNVLSEAFAIHENRAVITDIQFTEGVEQGQLIADVEFKIKDTGEEAGFDATLEG